MSEFPKELHYSESHEWVRLEREGVVTIGITDYAQHQLGDLVFVDLPEVDTDVDSGDETVVLESVKTAADVYAPVTGEITEVNEMLRDNPAVINQDPYGEGWLFRMKINDETELDSLLDADRYASKVAEED